MKKVELRYWPFSDVTAIRYDVRIWLGT
jgi:hypothetical protein